MIRPVIRIWPFDLSRICLALWAAEHHGFWSVVLISLVKHIHIVWKKDLFCWYVSDHKATAAREWNVSIFGSWGCEDQEDLLLEIYSEHLVRDTCIDLKRKKKSAIFVFSDNFYKYIFIYIIYNFYIWWIWDDCFLIFSICACLPTVYTYMTSMSYCSTIYLIFNFSIFNICCHLVFSLTYCFLTAWLIYLNYFIMIWIVSFLEHILILFSIGNVWLYRISTLE